MTSFLFVLAYVTLSTRINPLSVSLGPLSSLLAESVPSSLSFPFSLINLSLDSFAFRIWSSPSCLDHSTSSRPSRCRGPNLLPGPPFVDTRRMGTRDALLQIQMGTYANGVTCYYTFPYTNNVLIGPHTLRAPRTGGRAPPFLPPVPRGKCGEDIRYARAVETDLSIVYSPRAFLPILSPKLECAYPEWDHFRANRPLQAPFFFKGSCEKYRESISGFVLHFAVFFLITYFDFCFSMFFILYLYYIIIAIKFDINVN